jgi:prepilin-type N-terminal cleavage/methylation domain-containing protein
MIERRAPLRGFTLLEMLAALAMTALLAGSLYASLAIAFKARASALGSLQAVRQGQWAVDLVAADLQSAAGPNGILAGTFEGQSKDVLGSAGDGLTFYATAEDVEPNVGIGDIKKIEYACETDPNSGQPMLVRRLTTNLLATVTPQPQEEVICRNLRNFTLRYFDGSSWQDTWDSTSESDLLPVAVQITVELEGVSGGSSSQFSKVLLIPCGEAVSTATTSGGSS